MDLEKIQEPPRFSGVSFASNVSTFSRSSRTRAQSQSSYPIGRPEWVKKSLSVPNMDVAQHFLSFQDRHEFDSVYIRPCINNNFRRENRTFDTKHGKYFPNDDADGFSKCPSYRKFKIPLNITCQERYATACKAYEEQFQYEINELINYQRTAGDAFNFVRLISYTTIWPPLHNQAELKHTGRHFFKLGSKERKRLDRIMSIQAF